MDSRSMRNWKAYPCIHPTRKPWLGEGWISRKGKSYVKPQLNPPSCDKYLFLLTRKNQCSYYPQPVPQIPPIHQSRCASQSLPYPPFPLEYSLLVLVSLVLGGAPDVCSLDISYVAGHWLLWYKQLTYRIDLIYECKASGVDMPVVQCPHGVRWRMGQLGVTEFP
jgi:hypothetical protein